MTASTGVGDGYKFQPDPLGGVRPHVAVAKRTPQGWSAWCACRSGGVCRGLPTRQDAVAAVIGCHTAGKLAVTFGLTLSVGGGLRTKVQCDCRWTATQPTQPAAETAGLVHWIKEHSRPSTSPARAKPPLNERRGLSFAVAAEATMGCEIRRSPGLPREGWTVVGLSNVICSECSELLGVILHQDNNVMALLCANEGLGWPLKDYNADTMLDVKTYVATMMPAASLRKSGRPPVRRPPARLGGIHDVEAQGGAPADDCPRREAADRGKAPRRKGMTSNRPPVESILRTDEVSVGRTVGLRYLGDNEIERYIVDDSVAPVQISRIMLRRYRGDPAIENFVIEKAEEQTHPTDVPIISPHSPLGRALMGRRVGDTVTYMAPSGSLAVEILSIGD